MSNEDRLQSTLDAILEVQLEILDVLRGGLSIKREYSKNTYSSPLTQEDLDTIDEEIDLEWWYQAYGEDYHPAKHMSRSGLPYSKKELDYLHKRLVEIASCTPEVNGGTHTFRAVGKKYCKSERNTFNCFACVPVQ